MKYLEKKQAEERLKTYEKDMELQELAARTIKKYIADVKQWLLEIDADVITKETVIAYKKELSKRYKAASVNSKIISINRYLRWLGLSELVVCTERIQTSNVLDKMITKENYFAMLKFAKDTGRMKMYYIMKTIAGTGIRIGELKYVTVETVQCGYATVFNKRKYRYVYFPERLCIQLLEYCKQEDIKAGIIFFGRKKGKMIAPETVWKNMKYIAEKTGIIKEAVYPHSLRHLFAKTYMEKVGDVTELADILGHNRLEVTWVYTKTSLDEKRERLNNLGL